jgi:hypothetical protein
MCGKIECNESVSSSKLSLISVSYDAPCSVFNAVYMIPDGERNVSILCIFGDYYNGHSTIPRKPRNRV